MEWEKFWTYLASAIMAALGGLWLYAVTRRRGHRRIDDMIVTAGGAGLLGAVIAMCLCAYWCGEFDGSAKTVAICTLSGMVGATPSGVLRWVRKLLMGGPGENGTPKPEPIGNPDSD